MSIIARDPSHHYPNIICYLDIGTITPNNTHMTLLTSMIRRPEDLTRQVRIPVKLVMQIGHVGPFQASETVNMSTSHFIYCPRFYLFFVSQFFFHCFPKETCQAVDSNAKSVFQELFHLFSYDFPYVFIHIS